MNLADARVLLTGATGGIGAATAKALLLNGAHLLLNARSELGLKQLRATLPYPERVEVCAADLTMAVDRERLCECAQGFRGGIDVLINNAGVSDLSLFDEHRAGEFERAVAINLLAPMHLCRELLPTLQRQPDAHIVNVGSVMGALGYPGYSLYCATKFGLRGFSEALRRELGDTQVRVHYLAPRATQTAINSAAVVAMNAALGTSMDPPARVATEIVRMLKRGQASRVIGWPENFFVCVNQLFPGLVDRALRQQLPTIRRHAARAKESATMHPERRTA